MPGRIPENSSILIPRLVCRDLQAEADFLAGALDAKVLGSRPDAEGNLAHALLTIGPAMIMLEREWPQLASRAPQTDGSSPVVLFLYVEDVDRSVERAVAGGAKLLVEAQNQFWGDRIAWIIDPADHVWTLATRIEETTADERARRWDNIRGSS
jgi:PhnB protein